MISSQFLCSQSWFHLRLWHVFLWTDQLCIQIMSFSYPRNPSNLSSSPSATALANSLVSSKLDYCNSLNSEFPRQISTYFNALIGARHHKHFKISTDHMHQHSKSYSGFQSNKESITKSVFSHTKHLQINNLPTSLYRIVFHFCHILFLQDLLIHSLFS